MISSALFAVLVAVVVVAVVDVVAFIWCMNSSALLTNFVDAFDEAVHDDELEEHAE